MIKKIIHFIKNQKHYLSSDRYIAFLRSKEITIGENCIIRFPRSTFIDLTRPHLISIGNRVDMNINFKIYTHDCMYSLENTTKWLTRLEVLL